MPFSGHDFAVAVVAVSPSFAPGVGISPSPSACPDLGKEGCLTGPDLPSGDEGETRLKLKGTHSHMNTETPKSMVRGLWNDGQSCLGVPWRVKRLGSMEV
jgi:hypothetical protein